MTENNNLVLESLKRVFGEIEKAPFAVSLLSQDLLSSVNHRVIDDDKKRNLADEIEKHISSWIVLKGEEYVEFSHPEDLRRIKTEMILLSAVYRKIISLKS